MEVNGRYPRLAMTWPCRGFDRAPFAPGLLACGWRRSTFTATHPAALFPPAQPTDCYAIVYRGRGLHQCPHQETHLPSTVRDGIPAHDLCRGSGTVLLSRCGRVSRRRGLFAIPSCVASDGTSSTAEQRRSTVRSTRGTGACRHPIPTIPTPGGVRSRLG